MSTANVRILAVSGSLRKQSANTSVLQAVERLLPEQATMVVFEGLDQLPHFNPDQDVEPPPPSVHAWRQALLTADAVVICTPEYAFGVPGSLKNALDWTVSSGELNEKPVAAISASPLYGGASHALAALLLTLKALGTVMTNDSSLSIAAVKSKMDQQGVITDASTLNQIRQVVAALIKTINERVS
jgi:chromate reductase